MCCSHSASSFGGARLFFISATPKLWRKTFPSLDLHSGVRISIFRDDSPITLPVLQLAMTSCGMASPTDSQLPPKPTSVLVSSPSSVQTLPIFRGGSCTDDGCESLKEHLGLSGVTLDVLLYKMMCSQRRLHLLSF